MMNSAHCFFFSPFSFIVFVLGQEICMYPENLTHTRIQWLIDCSNTKYQLIAQNVLDKQNLTEILAHHCPSSSETAPPRLRFFSIVVLIFHRTSNLKPQVLQVTDHVLLSWPELRTFLGHWVRSHVKEYVYPCVGAYKRVDHRFLRCECM